MKWHNSACVHSIFSLLISNSFLHPAYSNGNKFDSHSKIYGEASEGSSEPQLMQVWEMTPLALMASYWTWNIAAKESIQKTCSNGQTNEQLLWAHTICLFAVPHSGPDLASIKKDGNTPSAFGASKCLPLYTPASWGVYIVDCIQATCLHVFRMQLQFLKTSGVCSFVSSDNDEFHSNCCVPRESFYFKEMSLPNEKTVLVKNSSLILCFELTQNQNTCYYSDYIPPLAIFCKC